MNNKGKKTCADFGKRKKVKDKLLSFIDQQLYQSQLQQPSQTFQQYLCSQDLNSHFHKLHLHLEKEMFENYRKNVFLPDGIFILVQGSLTYVWTKNKNDRNLRDHLFSLSKAGSYSNLEGEHDKGNLLSTGYSICINSSFAVIESQNGNICTNEETLFLRIPPSTLQLTNFFVIKNQRLDYFMKGKFPFSSLFSSEPCSQINYNLHHTFKKKKYLFRNKFEVGCLAVVTHGSFYFRLSNSKIKQGSSFCLLQPGYQYEVSSSFLQLIDITDNPTILLRKSYIREQDKQKKIDGIKQATELRSLCNKISNSVSFCKSKKNSDCFEKQERRKKKDCSLFMKDNQQYWIVSSELSKQNLDKIRIKRKGKESQPKDSRKNVLFPVSKKQFKNPVTNISTPKQHLNKLQCNGAYSRLNNTKSSLLSRYEVYAKEVFSKFMRFQQRNFDKDQDQSSSQ